MADIKPNEDVKDEEEVKPTPSLDDVHKKTIEDLESDDNQEQDKEEPEDEPEKPEGEPDEPEPKEEDEPVKPEPEPIDPPPFAPEPEPEPEEPPKIQVRDAEGKVHEFETTDDIPDDFEPFTYKEFAVATAKLSQREIAVKEAQDKARQAAIDKDREERISRIKDGWELDEAALVKSGALEEDETKRKPTVDAIYKTMQDEAMAGRPVNSFAQAYEIHKYREYVKGEADKKAKANEEKKKRGGMVASGNNSAPRDNKNNRGKVFEAPPSGVSLDQVHEKYLNNL